MTMLDADIRKLLAEAPASQLDSRMKPFIERWSDPPTAIQILEVLDHCIHGSLASGFLVTLFKLAYEEALQAEGLTSTSVEAMASWRK